MITYQTEGVDMPDIQKRETTAWIKAVAASYGKKIGEIAYIFCSDEKILEVNRQYLQHDYSATSSSASTPSVPTPTSLPEAITAANCTVSSSTAFSTSAASTTRDLANGRLWRRRRTKRWG